MRTVGITFATDNFAGSAAALRHSALTTGKFDEFYVYGPKDIQWLMDTYPAHFESSRGYGWWAWKPFLIRNVMSKNPKDTVIVYIDSAAVFERPITPYAEHVTDEKPILLQRLGNWSDPKNDYRIRKWTKKSILNSIGGPEAGDSLMLEAAFQVYKNTRRRGHSCRATSTCVWSSTWLTILARMVRSSTAATIRAFYPSSPSTTQR